MESTATQDTKRDSALGAEQAAVPGSGLGAVDPGLHELGIDAPTATTTGPLEGRTKLAAWGLGIAGSLAFVTLVVGAIAVVNFALPYVHYAYLALVGAGGQDF
ncbi:hypothetical protein FB468_0901 [Leucobacter komagatae]|uniref:Uncharacterized protein n=1 Tax=Leucobacter komagatae TaxID=55969 RepID=A0A542Y498_9MICO|nr:hypothetical protein [Leucobacter komagatae]TQL42892.1 hypothetical protein FB468_0901 [Leucobacter komagatae]